MIVRTIEALFTLKAKSSEFEQVESLLNKIAQRAKDVAKTVAGLFALNEIRSFVNHTSESLSEMSRAAESLGITIDAMQELNYAAKRANIPLGVLEESFKELIKNAEAAKTGTSEAFMLLGFKPEEVAKRLDKPLELLAETADRLKELKNQSERKFIVDSLFGDHGSLMMGMLEKGSAGLKQMRKEARDLGLVLGGDVIRNSKRFADSMGKLSLSSEIAGQSLTGEVLGPLSYLSEKLANICIEMNKAKDTMGLFRVAALSLSVVLAALALKMAIAMAPFIIAAAPALLSLAQMGGALIAVTAVASDLWTAFEGGESLFGDLWHWSKYAFDQIGQGLTDLCRLAKDTFADLIPDFVKKGFASVFKVKGSFDAKDDLKSSQKSFAPSSSTISSKNHLVSNQSVNVSVNVKSQANPQAIGGEISKAVRKELEKERFNAFMGVMQYAG